MIDETIFEYMHELLAHTPSKFHRYLDKDIAWDARMIGITGARGVGKSTLLLQHIKENQADCLYISADHSYLLTHTLTELADDFVKEGGKHLFLDEVHKYEGWSRELKQIYDVHPGLQIIFTGSSILKIQEGEADLSRRALMYNMQGLSFREYLSFVHGIETPVYSLEEILKGAVKLDGLEHPLPLFRQYLIDGYYPFSVEGGFLQRMQQVVNQTMESDIAQYADLKAATVRKLKQMLGVIAQLAPYKPNADNLSKEIGVSKNNVPDYLVYLEKAGMIGLLRDDTAGMRGLGKVEKVYVDNPSLMNVLSEGNPNIGNIRETFFYNQMRLRQAVVASRIADFAIGGRTFEVGGKGKGQKQILDAKEGYIVKDDIEYGHGNIIPLWQFGLNY